MANKTFLGIVSEDAQGYQRTLEFRIVDIAFAAAQTLPTPTEIDAVINAIYGDTGAPSNSRVTGYYVKVEALNVGLGGTGGSPTSEAARVRNDVTGLAIPWMFSIPGLNKAALGFDPTNPNSIIMTASPWPAIETALSAAHIAVGDPDLATYTPSAALCEAATVFDGRRAPLRPK